MKTLPDSPNLGHLRRQAKDLLAGLRESRPGSSLADAQTDLAEQYGFRTWAELKAEVDRRKGQAETVADALTRAVAERFGLGEATGPMRSVARPDEIGRQWSLDTQRGRWAVRTLDTWVPIVDADTDVALQEAAAAAGVLLPAPRRSRSGAVVESIGGHSWRVYEWIHSGPPLVAPASASITHAVGGILARIHGLALPVDRISPWHASRVSDAEWHELAARARARRAVWASTLTGLLPALLDLQTLGEGVPAPSPVLSINGLGPGNVRLGLGDRIIVVGWEHAGGQPPSWELCNALMTWTVGAGGVNMVAARAMIEGYRAEAGSLPHLDIAMFRGAVGAWLNYAFGQAQWALDPGDAEDERHATRSVRHLLSHPPSRSTLEALLDGALAMAPR